MNAEQEHALDLICAWLRDNSGTPIPVNESDPPHVHLDWFIDDWHRWTDEDIRCLLSRMDCSGSHRRAAMVCEIAFGSDVVPELPRTHAEVFVSAHGNQSPPAIYLLPCSKVLTDGNAQRQRMQNFDVATFEAWLNISPWIDDQKPVVDVTVSFVERLL